MDENNIVWIEASQLQPSYLRNPCDYSALPFAFGLADLDSFMKEGILEWIQVLPEYRGKGIGKALVCELLTRMKGKARFATVSGDCNNINNPIKLYRKCGFVDNSIWYIAYEN